MYAFIYTPSLIQLLRSDSTRFNSIDPILFNTMPYILQLESGPEKPGEADTPFLHCSLFSPSFLGGGETVNKIGASKVDLSLIPKGACKCDDALLPPNPFDLYVGLIAGVPWALEGF